VDKYTEEQLRGLKDRWKGHEKKVNDLIVVIKSKSDWFKSTLYKNLMEELPPLPEGVEKCERDLRGANLRGANLSEAFLSRTNLSGAYLRRANLSKTHLKLAILSEAYLSDAKLSGANLRRANLSESNMRRVHLADADLRKANLSEADLRGASLAETNLSRANLSEAYMRKANLSETNLSRANLSGTNLREANLSGAYLGGVLYTTDEFFNRLTKWWIPYLMQHIPLLCHVPLVSNLIKKIKPLKITNFQGVDTTQVDGAKNPVLLRHMQDYQFIQGFKEKSLVHRLIFYPLWKWTSDCGRSLLIWMFWSLAFAIIFGLIYASLTCPAWLPGPIQDILSWADPKIYIDPHTFKHHVWTPIYFSIVTFTTLGFGDVRPQNAAGIFWVVLEVTFGYIMLGGLVSIFANKLARRA
jgi:uncharacterized protein YjbI with pentapeptide repeats